MSGISDVPRGRADPVQEGQVPPSALWLLFSLGFLAHPVATGKQNQEQEGRLAGKTHLSFTCTAAAEPQVSCRVGMSALVQPQLSN